jgi:hypothetical protein
LVAGKTVADILPARGEQIIRSKRGLSHYRIETRLRVRSSSVVAKPCNRLDPERRVERGREQVTPVDRQQLLVGHGAVCTVGQEARAGPRATATVTSSMGSDPRKRGDAQGRASTYSGDQGAAPSDGARNKVGARGGCPLHQDVHLRGARHLPLSGHRRGLGTAPPASTPSRTRTTGP